MLFEDINYEIFGLKRDNLFSPKETLTHGILFRDLYDPYKNYHAYEIVPSNEKEASLLKLYELDQVINDLNLYLDIHPKDDYYYSLFKKYVNDYKNEEMRYEKLYGPLSLCDTDYSNYMWIKNPWPWERSGDMYV